MQLLIGLFLAFEAEVLEAAERKAIALGAFVAKILKSWKHSYKISGFYRFQHIWGETFVEKEALWYQVLWRSDFRRSSHEEKNS